MRKLVSGSNLILIYIVLFGLRPLSMAFAYIFLTPRKFIENWQNVIDFLPRAHDFGLHNLLIKSWLDSFEGNYISFINGLSKLSFDSSLGLSLLLLVLFIIGYWTLLNYGKSRILLFLFMTNFIMYSFSCTVYFFVYLIGIASDSFSKDSSLGKESFFITFFFFVVGVTYLIFNFRIIEYLKSLSGHYSFQVDNLLYSTKLKRFWNKLFDVFVLTSLLYINKDFFTVFDPKSGIYEFLSSPYFISLLVFIGGFLYYFLSEMFFDQSPGKVLTKSCVISENGEKPSKLQIMKRNLLRYVPFEALTFLFGNKIHDRLSQTTVIDLK